MMNIAEALSLILEQCQIQEFLSEREATEALGKVLREDVLSDRHLPPFNRSMMDGFAFSFASIDPSQTLEVIAELFPGEKLDSNIQPGKNQVIKIVTGAAVPESCDTVIQHEWFEISGKSIKLKADKMIRKSANIHACASDAKKGDVLLKAGTILNSRHLAVLHSVGKTNVKVSAPLKVSVVTTGNEVLSPEKLPNDYQLRDANLYTLKAMAQTWSEEINLFAQIKDDEEELRTNLKSALNADLVIVSAGVSAGEKDFVPQILSELGVKKVFHKINLRPGHPLWFGVKGKTLVFGLPGNPVSGQVCFKLFVEPALKKISGALNTNSQAMTVTLTEDFNKTHPRHEYAMGLLTSEGARVLKNSGSGDFFHYANAQGLLSFPGESRLYAKGEKVEWLPL